MCCSLQARAVYAQHPTLKQTLAGIKSSYDARQTNSEQTRSLETFYNHHDKAGTGEVGTPAGRAEVPAWGGSQHSALRFLGMHLQMQCQGRTSWPKTPTCRLGRACTHTRTKWRGAHVRKHKPLVSPHKQVRVEDFKAGLALGGVTLSPMTVSTLRGAYGESEKSPTINYGAVRRGRGGQGGPGEGPQEGGDASACQGGCMGCRWQVGRREQAGRHAQRAPRNHEVYSHGPSTSD